MMSWHSSARSALLASLLLLPTLDADTEEDIDDSPSLLLAGWYDATRLTVSLMITKPKDAGECRSSSRSRNRVSKGINHLLAMFYILVLRVWYKANLIREKFTNVGSAVDALHCLRNGRKKHE